MKTPIKPEDIKKGDLIRYEHAEDSVGAFTAVEFLAEFDGRGCLPKSLGGQHFLLDRPTPPVELPREPTLGWLSAVRTTAHTPPPTRRLAVWHVIASDPSRSVQWDGDDCGIAPRWVSAFTPAVAVPKAALDEFRRVFEDAEKPMIAQIQAGDTFLAAVDAANGGDPE